VTHLVHVVLWSAVRQAPLDLRRALLRSPSPLLLAVDPPEIRNVNLGGLRSLLDGAGEALPSIELPSMAALSEVNEELGELLSIVSLEARLWRLAPQTRDRAPSACVR
jgi:hypothetical protein